MLGLALAANAAAAHGFDYIVEVVFAVIVGKLFASFDVPLGPDPDSLIPRNYSLGIGPARMIDVAGDIVAGTPINRELIIQFEEIFAGSFFNLFIGNQWTKILDDPCPLRDWFKSYES